MKDPQINEPIYTHIQSEIDRTEKKSDAYRAMFYVSRMIQILLAAAVTVISGLWEKDDPPATQVLLIIGTLIAIVTAIETLFQFEAKKSTYKLILFELREIRAEIIYLKMKKGKLDENDLTEIFQRYRGVKATSRELIDREKDNVGPRPNHTSNTPPTTNNRAAIV